jgi:tetratricopeptide (TPR) repeat protein
MQSVVLAYSALCAAILLAACSKPKGTPGNAGAVADAGSARVLEATSLAAQAQNAQAAGDLSKAVTLYKQSVDLYPSIGAAWNNLGIALMQRGQEADFVAAAQAFQRAGNLLPTDPTPARNLGLLYQSRGFEEDALRYFEQALDIDPNDIDSLRGAAVSGKNLRRADEISLERLRLAQLRESDPKWRDIIQRERVRVEQDLAEKKRR